MGSILANGLLVATMMLATAMVAGCSDDAEIVQYTIDKRVPAELRNQKRMVGAIIPAEGNVWFFKLVGDKTQVTEVVPAVRQWISELKFADNQPQLTLPEGWINRGGSSMRFATVEIPSEPLPLELTISSLTKSAAWDELVAMNVNRWRTQLSLAESDQPFAGAEVFKTEQSVDGEASVWVDIEGEMSDAPSMSAPFAGATAADAPMPTPVATEQGSAKPLKYETPEGWREGRSGGMRMAAFNVGSEQAPAELTVIIAGGDVRSNVERWLGQIRPEGVDAATLDAVMGEAVKMEVAERPAQRFVLTGTGEKPQSIDATLVTLEEDVHLFVKMTGDATTVANESGRIEQFLNSIQLNL